MFGFSGAKALFLNCNKSVSEVINCVHNCQGFVTCSVLTFLFLPSSTEKLQDSRQTVTDVCTGEIG